MKYLNDSTAFTEYSNNINDTYENIEEYNSNKKTKNIHCIWYNCWYASWYEEGFEVAPIKSGPPLV